MSIIHDALKKVQEDLSHLPEASPRPQAAAPAEIPEFPEFKERALPPDTAQKTAAGTRSRTSSLTLRFWTIAGAIAPLLLLLVLISLRTLLKSAAPPSPPPESLSISGSAKTAPQPPASSDSGDIVLSGIIVMDGKYFALMNGEIWEAGETVGTAKILRIEEDRVEILQDEETKILKTRRK